MATKQLIERVLEAAIEQLRANPIPLYTFALYHDHESGAISVCADTRESSERCVASMNQYSAKHFRLAIKNGSLKDAALWQANVGRSLSLGDFARVNLARTALPCKKVHSDFYVEMVRALLDREADIARLAPNPEALVFACSGPESEVGLTWAVGRGSEKSAVAQ